MIFLGCTSLISSSVLFIFWHYPETFLLINVIKITIQNSYFVRFNNGKQVKFLLLIEMEKNTTQKVAL